LKTTERKGALLHGGVSVVGVSGIEHAVPIVIDAGGEEPIAPAEPVGLDPHLGRHIGRPRVRELADLLQVSVPDSPPDLLVGCVDASHVEVAGRQGRNSRREGEAQGLERRLRDRRVSGVILPRDHHIPSAIPADARDDKLRDRRGHSRVVARLGPGNGQKVRVGGGDAQTSAATDRTGGTGTAGTAAAVSTALLSRTGRDAGRLLAGRVGCAIGIGTVRLAVRIVVQAVVAGRFDDRNAGRLIGGADLVRRTVTARTAAAVSAANLAGTVRHASALLVLAVAVLVHAVVADLLGTRVNVGVALETIATDQGRELGDHVRSAEPEALFRVAVAILVQVEEVLLGCR